MKNRTRLAMVLAASFMGLVACTNGAGTATYRIEVSGSINAAGSVAAGYSTASAQLEIFAQSLPASKEFTAGANELVMGAATVTGGGNVSIRAYKNGTLCEEKSQSITDTGAVTAACNR